MATRMSLRSFARRKIWLSSHGNASMLMAMRSEYSWLAEPLLALEGALPRRFFGCDAVYVRGRLLLVLSDGDEPWNGAMFPVERVNHKAILERWPQLREHPVLPKWLYLSATNEQFELLARALVREIAMGNPLFGVATVPKKRASGGARAASKKAGRGRANADAAAAQKTDKSAIPPHLRD